MQILQEDHEELIHCYEEVVKAVLETDIPENNSDPSGAAEKLLILRGFIKEY